MLPLILSTGIRSSVARPLLATPNDTLAGQSWRRRAGLALESALRVYLCHCMNQGGSGKRGTNCKGLCGAFEIDSKERTCLRRRKGSTIRSGFGNPNVCHFTTEALKGR